MRYSLLWDLKQFVFNYRRFDTVLTPIFKGQAVRASWTIWTLKKGPIDCPETSATINWRCVISQKSKHLSYALTEAYDLSQCYTRIDV